MFRAVNVEFFHSQKITYTVTSIPDLQMISGKVYLTKCCCTNKLCVVNEFCFISNEGYYTKQMAKFLKLSCVIKTASMAHYSVSVGKIAFILLPMKS